MAVRAAELVAYIGSDTADAEAGFERVERRMGGLAQSFAAAGATMAAAFSAPLAGVAVTALNAAMDYESALNMMQAVSGASAEEMERVAETARALGADLSLPATSAADAALAMVELAKAGLSVEQATEAARGVLQLAIAGQLSEAQAAEIAANALNAFGLEGERAADVANFLAAAANASSAEVTDLADGLRMSSAVFAAAGIPIEDLVTALSMMANAGIKGSDAGTSLKTMMLSLQAPTSKAAETMSELGITIYDAAGNMLPLQEIIGQFTDKMRGLTQEQRNAALATIFGSDAVRAANVVLLGGAEAFSQMRDAVTDEGAAARLAGARMEGLRGVIEGIKSQLETFLLDAATPFLETLEGIGQTVADDIIPALINLDPNIRNAGLAFLAVLAAVGPLTLGLSGLSAVLGALASPLGIIAIIGGAIAAAYAGNIGGFRDFVDSQLPRLLAFVQDIAARAQPFIDAMYNIAQGLIMVVREGDPANDFFANAAQLVPALSGVIDMLVAGLSSLVEAFGLLRSGDMTGAMLAILPPDVVAGILTAFTVIRSVVLSFVDVIVNTVWPTLQQAFGELGRAFGSLGITWQDVGNAILTVLKALGIVVATVILAIIGIIAGLANAIANALVAVGQSGQRIFADLRMIFDGLRQFFTQFIAAIRALVEGDWMEFFRRMGEAGRGLAQAVHFAIQWVIDIFRGGFEIIIGFVRGFVEGIIGFFTNLYNRLVGRSIIPDMLTAIYNAFVGKLNDVIGFVTGWVERIISALREKIAALRQAGADLIGGLIDGISSLAQRVVDTITGLVGDAIDAARRLLGISSPSRVYAEIGRRMMEGWAQGIASGAPQVSRVLEGVSRTLAIEARAAVAPVSASGVRAPAANITINVHGSVLTERDLVDVVRNALIDINRLTAGGALA